jgi:hypothetical protein
MEEVLENRQPDKQIIFDDNFSLLLRPPAANFKKSYGYLLTIKNGEQESTLKYEVDITYLKSIPEVGRLFKIERTSKVYVDNMEPDLLIDKLANETGAALYPLVIETDFNGEFLKIHNYKEIEERWQLVKAKLREYFTGEISENYYKLMDKTIASESLLDQSIRNDMLISTYFTRIYKSYTSNHKTEEETAYPLAGKAIPVRFNVTQQVQNHLNDLGSITLQCEGTAIDERSIMDIEQERSFPYNESINLASQPVEGLYNCRYTLHAQTRFIWSINAQWTLNLNNQRIVTVKIHETVKDIESVSKNNILPYDTNIIFIDKDDRHGNIFKSVWKSLFG